MQKLSRLFQNRIVQLAIAILVLLGFILVSFYFGFAAGLSQPREVVLKNIIDVDAPPSVGADFNTFWQAWDILKTDYLKSGEVVDQNLVYGAIEGLVQALDDPYSVYLPPSDAKKFSEDVGGSFGGVGMEIGIKEKQLTVIAPIKDSPAGRAGLKAGDKILQIDDTPTADLDVNEAVKLIRGPVGTDVVLLIARDGIESATEYKLTREVIQIPTLDFEMKEGNIAYIQIYSFNENLPHLFYNAAIKAAFGGAEGMVLDLRGNPGGFLEIATHLAGWFLERNSTVVVEEFGSGRRDILRANGNALFEELPLVVLVDKGSASASEILAGALRDVRGVKLVGEKTFGKGTVQELKELSDGSVVKITIAHWLLPNGDLIEKNGIEPDVLVELTEEDREEERDPQLEKALEIVKGEIAKSN